MAHFQVYPEQFRLLIETRPPPKNASAALIMDLESGQVVYSYNADIRLAPASTTKIMTAIIALEQGSLDDRVLITESHAQEGSIMGLLTGDVATLEDLLWGLLLPSGNDAAMAIAEHVGGGSVEDFVAKMNQKAEELGLSNTHFVNPHGHDALGHYSSASDLAIMARYALRKPLFAQMVATERRTVTTDKVYYLYNTNQLLRMPAEVPGVDGVKTGFTDDAGDCLVASVSRGGRRVLVIVLGSESRVEATIPLINYAFSAFTWVKPSRSPFLHLTDDEGREQQLSIEEPSVKMIARWQLPYLQSRFILLQHQSPYTDTVPVGIVQYTLGKTVFQEQPAFLAP
jgi:D-alanyl-D-alanine carboxypeptidase (penicillin-binding protein 5/6)